MLLGAVSVVLRWDLISSTLGIQTDLKGEGRDVSFVETGSTCHRKEINKSGRWNMEMVKSPMSCSPG